ncbi:hypothetical protein PMAYCL1PPCAC_06056, partial [Pristionchus mayeri]
GDSGGPRVRPRVDDGVNELWDAHSSQHEFIKDRKEAEERRKSYAVSTTQIRSFVCQFTGVCTDGYDNYDSANIPITVSDNISPC